MAMSARPIKRMMAPGSTAGVTDAIEMYGSDIALKIRGEKPHSSARPKAEMPMPQARVAWPLCGLAALAGIIPCSIMASRSLWRNQRISNSVPNSRAKKITKPVQTTRRVSGLSMLMPPLNPRSLDQNLVLS
jgi:hypothetical protein